MWILSKNLSLFTPYHVISNLYDTKINICRTVFNAMKVERGEFNQSTWIHPIFYVKKQNKSSQNWNCRSLKPPEKKKKKTICGSWRPYKVSLTTIFLLYCDGLGKKIFHRGENCHFGAQQLQSPSTLIVWKWEVWTLY